MSKFSIILNNRLEPFREAVTVAREAVTVDREAVTVAREAVTVVREAVTVVLEIQWRHRETQPFSDLVSQRL